MAAWRNAAGRPLSSTAWLDAHHRAKLDERRRFAQRIAGFAGNTIVDLGCGTGLWLDVLDPVLPGGCELVGIDIDPEALDAARTRSRNWRHASHFLVQDLDRQPELPPGTDLVLAFNVFPYLSNPMDLLGAIRGNGRARLIVRQYDGGTIRIGPMTADDRFAIDSSLRASLESSGEFRHYDLDRTYTLLRESRLRLEELCFEVTQRHGPFPLEFLDFFRGTVEWMSDHLSDDARARLHGALGGWELTLGENLYFAQMDLVAVLSAGR